MEALAADDNAETRSALFKALLDTTLVAATPNAPTEERSWVAGEGEQIGLVTLDTDEGSAIPVFTSVDRLLEWQPEGAGYVALPSRALFEMLAGSGTALEVNPGSATRGTIVPSELEALARGRVPVGDTEVLAAGTEVRLGRAAQPPPDDVVGAVRRAVAAEQRAAAAWLYLMQQGTNDPEHVVGIALADGLTEDAEQAAIRNIAEYAGSESPGARELLFIGVDKEFHSDLAEGAGDLVFARTQPPDGT
jgi:SseB protein N-terminal domain/SseB protein C-terminal domain